jgi:signal transduction histidine kinase
VVCFAVAHRHLRLWLSLVLGAAAILVAAFLMVFQEDGWVSWTGGLFAFGPAPEVSAVVCLALIGWVLLVIVWATTAGSRALSALSNAERVNEVIEDRLADSEVQLAIAEERNRIAQEMHDVLAHSLTVVIAQADGARYVRTKRPAAVDASLRSIAESARNALVDVGGIIDGVLDGKPAPQPGLAALEGLVSTVTDTGMTVTFTQSGEPRELAPGQQLAVYRIVQEGLTNALRHRGRTSAATIVFDWRGPGLALQLVSSGGEVDSTPPERGRPGRGIPGMQERARLTGGWATAGLDDNGDHRLTAFIPFRDTQQPDTPMTAAA